MDSQILIVDDDPSILSLLETHAQTLGMKARLESDAQGMRGALDEEEFSVILLDINLPDASGIDLLKELQNRHAELPVIMITASGEVEHAVQSMKAGAYDYCQKPIDLQRLKVSLKNAVERYELRQQLSSYQRIHRQSLCGMIGGSPRMQVVYRMIELAAPTKAPVLITGESGTGKELVAQAIHRLSPRGDKELIDLNCSAIPKTLLENELFGHEPHAFTGAGARYIGSCERAHQSTLFLDEVAEMDYSLQAKLLRFLQDFSFVRVGGGKRIHVDVRVVAATNKAPLQALQNRELREDLYYRLNVVNIPLPALRERPEDIPDLAEHFLKACSKEMHRPCRFFDEQALDVLCRYPWPGNVRELENAIRQCVVLHPQETLHAEMLPEAIRQGAEHPGRALIAKKSKSAEAGVEHGAEPPDAIVPIETLERRAIEHALTVLSGNVAKAAGALHVSQATLYRKLKDYGLVLDQFKH